MTSDHLENDFTSLPRIEQAPDDLFSGGDHVHDEVPPLPMTVDEAWHDPDPYDKVRRDGSVLLRYETANEDANASRDVSGR